MNFQQFCSYIKAQGCKIRLYKKKTSIGGAVGLFQEEPAPLISLAILCCSKKRQMELLAHEFAHFLQYKDGFTTIIENICEYGDWVRWTDREIELSEKEVQAVRNTVLAIEWDAEMRAMKLAKELGLEGFNEKSYLRSACAYMETIKWSFLTRGDFVRSINKKLVEPRVYTLKELFAPLTAREKKKFSGWFGRSNFG